MKTATVNQNRQNMLLLCLLSVGIFSGCEYLPTMPTPAAQPVQQTARTGDVMTAPAQTGQASSTPLTQLPEASGREEIVEIGTGRFVAETTRRATAASPPGSTDITLNFQDTDLREFIQAILGNILNENYLIDPAVSGRVTIQTANPIPRSELFGLFENILSMNNAAIVRIGTVYQIVPGNQAVTANLSPSTVTSSALQGHSVRIIPLQFIAAQEMQKILEPFVSEPSSLRIDQRRNLVIISGTAQQINTVQETVDIFDVDWLRGMSVGLYPLDYVDPVTLQRELDAIISGIEGTGSNEMLGGLVRTVPLERLNSILLIGSTVAALREVEIWMRRLDKPGDQAGKRLYVYNVQNAKAIELAEILSHIFRGSSESTTASAQQQSLIAPGLEPVQISNSPQTDTSQSQRPMPAITNTATGIDIIADDVRNALVILASVQEYKMVEAAIAKLDIVPLQVLIEASIIEVSLNNNLNYGVEWFFKNRVDGTYQGRGTLDLGDPGIGALAPSFAYTVVNNANDVRVALNALAAESTIKVLSSPSLMVLDNKTATINIGDEIPVPTRQSVSVIDPDAPTINEIQFRKTGVTLTVTPRVNQSGLVTMAIRQEVSNAVNTTSSNIDAPTIQQRQIESEVAINSGETIILGGLIQDNQSSGNSGVPGLRRIPILGNLFSQNLRENNRTELLVLITPRVVGSRNEARDITEEFRRKMQGLAPATPEI